MLLANVSTLALVLALAVAATSPHATSQDGTSAHTTSTHATLAHDISSGVELQPGGVPETSLSLVTSTGSNETAADRKGKLFPLLRLITFDNGPCEAADGHVGTCYSSGECRTLGGLESGLCAGGYGACCVFTATCSAVIKQNNTYWTNPGHPGAYNTPGMCMAEIVVPARTVQILLTFVAFDILGPINGDCANDTFTFVGGNVGQGIPVLCGHNTGQHYYVSISSSTPPYKIVMNLAALSYSRYWKIRVTYILSTDRAYAPFGCLQYFLPTSGQLSSFNYGGPFSQLLNNLNYAICFAQRPGFCGVGLSFTTFDIGTSDIICGNGYVALGPQKFCGHQPSLTLPLNCTGPLVVYVRTDFNNDFLQLGFTGTYLSIPN